MAESILLLLNALMYTRFRKCGERRSLSYVLGTWLSLLGFVLLASFVGAGARSQGVILFIAGIGYVIAFAIAISGLRTALQMQKNYERYQERLANEGKEVR